jgi:hypothetical protein
MQGIRSSKSALPGRFKLEQGVILETVDIYVVDLITLSHCFLNINSPTNKYFEYFNIFSTERRLLSALSTILGVVVVLQSHLRDLLVDIPELPQPQLGIKPHLTENASHFNAPLRVIKQILEQSATERVVLSQHSVELGWAHQDLGS